MMIEPKLRFKADDGSDFPDWEEQKIEDVCVLNPRTEQLDDEFYYMDLGSIDHGRWEAPEIVNKVDAPSRAQRVAAIDDVFFQSVRPYNMGHYHYVAAKVKQVGASTGYIQARMRNGSNAFLYQLFYEERFNAEVNARCTGSNYPAINSRKFGEITVALPSLPEQRKIADLLSAVDDVIAAQEAEVAAWEKRKKGVMQKLFSQEVRFKADDGSDFPDWEEKTLGDICMYERQRSEGANFVGTENMLKDFGGVTFDNSNADGSGTLYHPGDTLMSNIRPYLKKAWLADRKGTCSTDVLVFHPTSVEPGYLYWLIASDAFVRYVMSAAKGSKMPRGDKKHIMEMPLLLPNKDEQRKIDDCLSSLNDVIIKAKNELAKWQELKKGLLQQMFV